jgi:hypothetical protein
MPTKLTIIISKIQSVPNPANAAIIDEFCTYMKNNRASESPQNNNLKVTITFAKFLGTHNHFIN